MKSYSIGPVTEVLQQLLPRGKGGSSSRRESQQIIQLFHSDLRNLIRLAAFSSNQSQVVFNKSNLLFLIRRSLDVRQFQVWLIQPGPGIPSGTRVVSVCLVSLPRHPNDFPHDHDVAAAAQASQPHHQHPKVASKGSCCFWQVRQSGFREPFAEGTPLPPTVLPSVVNGQNGLMCPFSNTHPQRK